MKVQLMVQEILSRLQEPPKSGKVKLQARDESCKYRVILWPSWYPGMLNCAPVPFRYQNIAELRSEGRCCPHPQITYLSFLLKNKSRQKELPVFFYSYRKHHLFRLKKKKKDKKFNRCEKWKFISTQNQKVTQLWKGWTILTLGSCLEFRLKKNKNKKIGREWKI